MTQQIFVIASRAEHANRRIAELKRHALEPGTAIVPVLSDADMRGRVVKHGDLAVVTGDWSRVPQNRVQQLVEMFNTRRDVGVPNREEIPMLHYRPGESPEVGWSVLPAAPEQHNRQVIGIETQPYPPAAGQVTTDPVTKTVKVFDGTVWHAQPVSTYTDAEVKRLVQELHEAKVKLDEIKAMMTEIDQYNEQLASWLSGVQPVEDPEIPGIFWCAICSRRLPAHADGCPAAP